MKRPRARRFDIPSDDRTNFSSTNGVRDTIGSEPSVLGKGAVFESDPPKELPAAVLRERRRVCGEFGIGLVLTSEEPYLIMDGTDLRRWAHLRFDPPITAVCVLGPRDEASQRPCEQNCIQCTRPTHIHFTAEHRMIYHTLPSFLPAVPPPRPRPVD